MEWDCEFHHGLIKILKAALVIFIIILGTLSYMIAINAYKFLVEPQHYYNATVKVGGVASINDKLYVIGIIENKSVQEMIDISLLDIKILLNTANNTESIEEAKIISFDKSSGVIVLAIPHHSAYNISTSAILLVPAKSFYKYKIAENTFASLIAVLMILFIKVVMDEEKYILKRDCS